jgi:endonuclease YncB( thermonuclease family)
VTLRSLLAVLLMLGTSAAGAQELTGNVTRIVDGDTFDIGEQRIRLCGIDAPEDNQQGAAAATDFLAQVALGKVARCVVVGGGTPCDGKSKATNRGRTVAQCFVAGEDLADLLVRAEHACDWPRFSGGYYSQAKCSR